MSGMNATMDLPVVDGRELPDEYRNAANGGYRSPGHAISDDATPHLWGTAVNIHRIGDDFLNSPETIGRYTELIKRLLPGAWVRPYESDVGGTIDHLHVDLGRFVLTPREKDTCEEGF